MDLMNVRNGSNYCQKNSERMNSMPDLPSTMSIRAGPKPIPVVKFKIRSK
jgi:hypothetical protein